MYECSITVKLMKATICKLQLETSDNYNGYTFYVLFFPLWQTEDLIVHFCYDQTSKPIIIQN